MEAMKVESALLRERHKAGIVESGLLAHSGQSSKHTTHPAQEKQNVMDINAMNSPETDTHYYSLNQLNEGASHMRFAMRKLSHLGGMDGDRLGEYVDQLEELRAAVSSMVMDVLLAEEEFQRQQRQRHPKTITLPPSK